MWPSYLAQPQADKLRGLKRMKSGLHEGENMKGIRAPWLICLFLSGGTYAATSSPPSAADIQTWWSHNSNEKLMLNEQPVAIRLANGELATSKKQYSEDREAETG